MKCQLINRKKDECGRSPLGHHCSNWELLVESGAGDLTKDEGWGTIDQRIVILQKRVNHKGNNGNFMM